jgi:hypothetical protein
MSPSRWVASVLVAALVCANAGCGDEKPAGDGLAPEGGHERPAVFDSGELVWAHRSAIHVGDQDFDVSPQQVYSMDWTPYGLFLRLTRDPSDGPFTEAFYDGTTMTPIDDVYGEIVTSPDGELAAWIDRSGPERPAGQVAQVLVVEVRTGDVVFSSAEGMGGEKGDDMADRYEELTPAVVELTSDEVVWINSEGTSRNVTSNLETGESTTSDKWARPATSGYEFTSPDGHYRVDATNTGRLKVKPRQPDFGHKWVFQGGWLGPHQMVVLGQDTIKWSYDPDVPDTIPGFILSCDLDVGTCQQLRKVVGARDVVFAGIDVNF